jgi:GAF domain-containing protein
MLNQYTEPERHAKLAEFDLESPELQRKLSTLSRLAARVFDMPVALVNIVERLECRFRGHSGLPEGADRVPADVSLCADPGTFDKVVVYEDTHLDPKLEGNPLVHGEFQMRFYAGQPLIARDGLYLGKFCIIDHRPRFLASEQREWLQDFAQVALDHLEAHRRPA